MKFFLHIHPDQASSTPQLVGLKKTRTLLMGPTHGDRCSPTLLLRPSVPQVVLTRPPATPGQAQVTKPLSVLGACYGGTLAWPELGGAGEGHPTSVKENRERP